MAKFRRKLFENDCAIIFSKNRSRRCDDFDQKIIKIGTILAVFRPFEDFGHFLAAGAEVEYKGLEGGNTRVQGIGSVSGPPGREDYRREVN